MHPYRHHSDKKIPGFPKASRRSILYSYSFGRMGKRRRDKRKMQMKEMFSEIKDWWRCYKIPFFIALFIITILAGLVTGAYYGIKHDNRVEVERQERQKQLQELLEKSCAPNRSLSYVPDTDYQVVYCDINDAVVMKPVVKQ